MFQWSCSSSCSCLSCRLLGCAHAAKPIWLQDGRDMRCFPAWSLEQVTQACRPQLGTWRRCSSAALCLHHSVHTWGCNCRNSWVLGTVICAPRSAAALAESRSDWDRSCGKYASQGTKSELWQQEQCFLKVLRRLSRRPAWLSYAKPSGGRPAEATACLSKASGRVAWAKTALAVAAAGCELLKTCGFSARTASATRPPWRSAWQV